MKLYRSRFLVCIFILMSCGGSGGDSGSSSSAAVGGDIAFVGESTYGYGIYVMNADGSNLDQSSLCSAYSPSWSVDGRKLAFIEVCTGGWPSSWAYYSYTTVYDGVFDTHITSENSRYPTWSDPQWSPDGLYILLTDSTSIYRYKSDGTAHIFLAAGYSGVWSPDGSKIAFVTDRDGNEEIYVMNSDGTNQINLSQSPGRDYSPAWSPNGRRIAFVSERDGNAEIFVMDLDGSDQINLSNSPGMDYWPVWSPNGASIAFVSDRDGNNEIYVVSQSGGAAMNLTNNAANDREPTWSSDSSKIAFTSSRSGTDHIYVMHNDGSNQIDISRQYGVSPAWNPNR